MQDLKFSRGFSWVLALCVVASAANAQEIQGQKGLSGGSAAIAKGVNVTQAQLNGADKQSADWLHTNGGYEQTRFYPGKQINAGNVAKLQAQFTFQTEVR